MATNTYTNQTKVQNGSIVALLIGADSGATTLTDATLKVGRYGVPHYTNAEEPLSVFYAKADSATNELYFGGGSAVMNAATSVRFYTAANTTTTSGTRRMDITSDVTVDFDLAVNGGDLTSTASTFNLLNATVTTLNFAGAATALTIGATTGVTTFRNRMRRASKTVTATTGNVDAADANHISLNPASPYNLTTISNGAAGDEVLLINISANTVTIKDGTGNIQCGADVALAAKGVRKLVYSAATSEWLMIGNNGN